MTGARKANLRSFRRRPATGSAPSCVLGGSARTPDFTAATSHCLMGAQSFSASGKSAAVAVFTSSCDSMLLPHSCMGSGLLDGTRIFRKLAAPFRILAVGDLHSSKECVRSFSALDTKVCSCAHLMLSIRSKPRCDSFRSSNCKNSGSTVSAC